MTEPPIIEGPICALPLSHNEQIVMGHGSGGRMSHDLIRLIFQSKFDYPPLVAGNDFASVVIPSHTNGRLAVSTDAHIVAPLFFPGGDIGRLAICGTVNDISMSGAKPLYLTASFIIEEGLPIGLLQSVVSSMRDAADEANIQIIAGDTKVAEKGKVDQLFISTTGIGWIPEGREISGSRAQPGDAVLISGSLGEHGIAVITARGELGIETNVQSDVAPLNKMIENILSAAPGTHVLRDPTRGGLATTLNEIALQSNVSILLEENMIPVTPSVRNTCEMLGFDPLYIANEGKIIVITPSDEAEAALEAMKRSKYGASATRIGSVVDKPGRRVVLRTSIGGTRILDMLSGEILPRIC